MSLLAVIGEINPQIHEIVSSKARLIHDLLQHCLINFIRNVTKHDLGVLDFKHAAQNNYDIYRSANVNALSDLGDINVIMV
jgi:hypothetical protein